MLSADTVNKYLTDHGKPANVGYLLLDSGSGNYIAQWTVDIPQPTEADIAAAQAYLDAQVPPPAPTMYVYGDDGAKYALGVTTTGDLKTTEVLP